MLMSLHQLTSRPFLGLTNRELVDMKTMIVNSGDRQLAAAWQREVDIRLADQERKGDNR